jgi:GNAT superfamily N-acetyltransferase
MLKIRRGERQDLPAVLSLIQELALYEKAPHEVTNTVKDMERDGFGSHPIYFLWVAEKNEKIVGIAICYIRYSTWKGQILYLEDIVVTEKERGKKIGHQLMNTVIQFAQEEQYNGLIWQVLDWNEPAIRFYKKYNAQFDGEWFNVKLNKEQLQQFQFHHASI